MVASELIFKRTRTEVAQSFYFETLTLPAHLPPALQLLFPAQPDFLLQGSITQSSNNTSDWRLCVEIPKTLGDNSHSNHYKLKSLSFCIVVPECEDKNALMQRLYLAIESNVSVNLTLYTHDEWTELLKDPSSYAAWIGRRGRVIYEPAP